MSGPARREARGEVEMTDQRGEASDDEATVAEQEQDEQEMQQQRQRQRQQQQQQEQQQQQQQQQWPVDVCVRVVTRAVERWSPGGTRRASATTTTKITVPEYEQMEESEEEEEEVEEEEEAATVQEPSPPPVPRPARWVIADGRSGSLETEPAKSNLARAHTLLGVVDRLRECVVAEAQQLLKLQEDVASAGARALRAVRLYFLENGFRRRLQNHLELVVREMLHLHEVQGHFDPDGVQRNAGGPALRLMDDLSSSGSAACSSAAEVPVASTSGRLTPDARQRGDSEASTSAAAAQDVSKAAEAGAATCSSSVGGGGEAPNPFSHMRWSHDRFEKGRTKGSSSSSNGSKSSDSLMASASALQEPSEGVSEAAAVDTLLHAVVEESEANAAMEVFCELQREFGQLADAMRQHSLVADGMVRQAGQRRLRGGEAGAEGPPTQQLLLHDLQLMHSQMQLTEMLMCESEAALQSIVDSLPASPALLQLPPITPAQSPRSGLAWLSDIFRRRSSQGQT